jgi:hypothetical protein
MYMCSGNLRQSASTLVNVEDGYAETAVRCKLTCLTLNHYTYNCTYRRKPPNKKYVGVQLRGLLRDITSMRHSDDAQEFPRTYKQHSMLRIQHTAALLLLLHRICRNCNKMQTHLSDFRPLHLQLHISTKASKQKVCRCTAERAIERYNIDETL